MQFLESLTGLSTFSFPLVVTMLAVFARISAIVFFLPGLGEQMIPIRVRLASALAISLIVTPAIISSITPPTELIYAALAIAAEGVSGAFIGFSIRIAIFIVQTTGAIASQSLSLAQLFGASVDLQPETSISTLLTMTAIVLAVCSGLHFEIISVLIKSFVYIPFGIFPGADYTGEWAANRTAFSFVAALSLALPFVALGFVYNLAIGAANRAMPQLMVAFVGIPAITMAGLILLALSAPVLLETWMQMLHEILMTLLQV